MIESTYITAVQAIGLIAFDNENVVAEHLLEYLGTTNKEKYGNVIYKSYLINLLELIEQNRPFPNKKFVPAPDTVLTKEDVEKIIEATGLSFADFKQDLLTEHAKEENIKKIINDAKQIFLNALLAEELKIFGELRKINIETGDQKIEDHDSNEIPTKFLRRDDVVLGLHDNGYRVLTNVDSAFLYGISPSKFNGIIAKNIYLQDKWRTYWGNLKVKKSDAHDVKIRLTQIHIKEEISIMPKRGKPKGVGEIDDTVPLEKMRAILSNGKGKVVGVKTAAEVVAADMKIADKNRPATVDRWRRKYRKQ